MIIPPIGSDAATSDDMIGQLFMERISVNMVALRTHAGIGIQANGTYTCTSRNGIATTTSASTSVNINVAVQGLSPSCLSQDVSITSLLSLHNLTYLFHASADLKIDSIYPGAQDVSDAYLRFTSTQSLEEIQNLTQELSSEAFVLAYISTTVSCNCNRGTVYLLL